MNVEFKKSKCTEVTHKYVTYFVNFINITQIHFLISIE